VTSVDGVKCLGCPSRGKTDENMAENKGLVQGNRRNDIRDFTESCGNMCGKNLWAHSMTWNGGMSANSGLRVAGRMRSYYS